MRGLQKPCYDYKVVQYRVRAYAVVVLPITLVEKYYNTVLYCYRAIL